MGRAIAYIDGFNLYYGMRKTYGSRFHWLDVHALASRFVPPGDTLVATHYFTAIVKPVPTDPDKPARQNNYIRALRSIPELSVHLGSYMEKPLKCPYGHEHTTFEEKKSDVALACQILLDVHFDQCDTIILVSADGDLVVPVRLVRNLFPERNIVVVYPPGNSSREYNRLHKNKGLPLLHITQTDLIASQFPDVVTGEKGKTFTRPQRWRRSPK